MSTTAPTGDQFLVAPDPGGARTTDPAIAAATARQARSCGLALSVREALGETFPTGAPALCERPPAPSH
ncbi:hypothetical protein [Polyangium sp. 15x6]|uniref:hypothetical protein n=1 Tax=Polyangium sp. 15x6 TaxID=3042687 RepID=UPI00249BC65C|nr:hypothetical protein [Polyangium sp. 15x6]MDI3291601.1 hypothetical protein [Polyangium sp. 15x6]